MIPVYIGYPCQTGVCGGFGPPTYWWQPDPRYWARPVVYGGCTGAYSGSLGRWGCGGGFRY